MKVDNLSLYDDVEKEIVTIEVDGKILCLDNCKSYEVTRKPNSKIEIEITYQNHEKVTKKIFFPKKCDIQILKKPSNEN